jgi:hypothetical protein
MEQIPSWEAKSASASQNSLHVMEIEGSLPHSQDLTTCPYPEPDLSSPISIQSLEDPF